MASFATGGTSGHRSASGIAPMPGESNSHRKVVGAGARGIAPWHSQGKPIVLPEHPSANLGSLAGLREDPRRRKQLVPGRKQRDVALYGQSR